MTIFNFITLLGGLALFLYGMRLMGDGLKRSSSGAFKRAMEKVTNSPFKSFLLGLMVTCIIQSSTATIVLTAGLVGAGILSLHQCLGIILGANVGTTITGQIIRLMDINADAGSWLNAFKPSTLAPVAAVIGIILIMSARTDRTDVAGSIAVGFGILFTGLMNMTAAVAPLADSPKFADLFLSLSDKPFLGFLAGAAVAFAIQSSSATIGILQALSVTGTLSLSNIYSIIIGIYIGDCVTTAIVCSIGARADAKRVGIVHILFNLCEVVLVTAGMNILHGAGVFNSIWSVPLTAGGIANTHTLFNLICAVIILPFVTGLEKLSKKIVKDDQEEITRNRILTKLDKTFYATPEIALQSAHDVTVYLAEKAVRNVGWALGLFDNYDTNVIADIENEEDKIDDLSDKVSDYLQKLSAKALAANESKRLSYYIHCVSEFERIGDHALNISENATKLKQDGNAFSPEAQKELHVMTEALTRIMNYSLAALRSIKVDDAKHIEPVEEVIDILTLHMRDNHFERLNQGICNVSSGFNFLDVLTDMERISDQCSNIGVHTIGVYSDDDRDLEHNYIKRLHAGEDPQFNQEYAENKTEFFGKLGIVPVTEA